MSRPDWLAGRSTDGARGGFTTRPRGVTVRAMAEIMFSFFAQEAVENPNGSYDLRGVFLSGSAPPEFPAVTKWAVVGRIAWDQGDAERDHSIAVRLRSPDGVEPADYVSEPLGRRPFVGPSGAVTSTTFVIDIEATFFESGMYAVEVTVDGNIIDLPLFNVVHSPPGDSLTVEFFTADE